jgi:hypothetical protein
MTLQKAFSLLLALLMFSVFGCQSGPKEAEQESETTTEESTANVLSEAEQAEGFMLLFDGQSLDGWRSFQRDTVAGWTVEDGAIARVGGGGDIITEREFDNFDFHFEWKISPQGNSGVMYFVVESDEYNETYATGPEYQVLDDLGFPQELKEDQYAGANYDMHVPSQRVTKPAGEWNQSRIVSDNNRIEHWLNGVKVVEYEIGSEDWENRVQNSKWKDFPGYGKARRGHIALQDHGNPVWFRNLKIKELPAAQ